MTQRIASLLGCLGRGRVGAENLLLSGASFQETEDIETLKQPGQIIRKKDSSLNGIYLIL